MANLNFQQPLLPFLVFTVTFYQFNASLLNKSIRYFKRKKNLTDPNFFEWYCKCKSVSLLTSCSYKNM